MLCDHCKEKEATVHLTQVVESEIKKLHLCEGCAEQAGFELDGSMSLNEILDGLGLQGAQEVERVPRDASSEKEACPRCGLTRARLKKKGRLGCPECYEIFRDELLPLLESVHGSREHCGKVPGRMRTELQRREERAALQEQLQAAIEKEAFEEAAGLRDRIMQIEGVNKGEQG